MVLAGVGGRTIAEAQRNLSYKEVTQWLKFFEQTEYLSVIEMHQQLIRQLDYISAKICWAVWKAAGAKNVSINDFLPEVKKDYEEATPQDALRLLSSIAKLGKRK